MRLQSGDDPIRCHGEWGVHQVCGLDIHSRRVELLDNGELQEEREG
jgi:hypothetical protein